MMTIPQLFQEINLHDSYLDSILIDNDGAMNLFINVDMVWNKDLDSDICGIRFCYVYEIKSYNINCLEHIEGVDFVEMQNYNRSFAVWDKNLDKKVYKVDFNFCSKCLSFICADSVEFIREADWGK